MAALRADDPEKLGAAVQNDLQPAALWLRPDLAEVLTAGVDASALGALLSGSRADLPVPVQRQVARPAGRRRRCSERGHRPGVGRPRAGPGRARGDGCGSRWRSRTWSTSSGSTSPTASGRCSTGQPRRRRRRADRRGRPQRRRQDHAAAAPRRPGGARRGAGLAQPRAAPRLPDPGRRPRPVGHRARGRARRPCRPRVGRRHDHPRGRRGAARRGLARPGRRRALRRRAPALLAGPAAARGPRPGRARRADQPPRRRGGRLAGRPPGPAYLRPRGRHPRPVVPRRGLRDHVGGARRRRRRVRRRLRGVRAGQGRAAAAGRGLGGAPAEPDAQGARLAAPRRAGADLEAEVPDRRRDRADRGRAAAARPAGAAAVRHPAARQGRRSTWRTSTWSAGSGRCCRTPPGGSAPATGSVSSGSTAPARPRVLRLLSGELAPDARPGAARADRRAGAPDPGARRPRPRGRGCSTSVEEIKRVTRIAGGEITATSMLERFGFTGDRLTARIGDLSGGERRRLPDAAAAARRSRTCCSSTSPPTTSTSRRSTCSRTSSTAGRGRWSWSRTTGTSWSGSATRSGRCSATARCRCCRAGSTSTSSAARRRCAPARPASASPEPGADRAAASTAACCLGRAGRGSAGDARGAQDDGPDREAAGPGAAEARRSCTRSWSEHAARLREAGRARRRGCAGSPPSGRPSRRSGSRPPLLESAELAEVRSRSRTVAGVPGGRTLECASRAGRRVAACGAVPWRAEAAGSRGSARRG